MRRASQVLSSSAANASSMMARRAASLATRAGQSRKRGSLARSGSPIARASAPNCFSLLTASRMWPPLHLEHVGRRQPALRPVARLALHVAAHRVVGHERGQERQRGIQHGHVDELAAARVRALVERARHRERRRHAADGIADGKARPHRPLSGMAGDRHDAAHRLDLAVVGGGGALGAGLAEARHRAIDEPRVQPRQHLVADAHPVHDAGAEVLHHHVGLGGEAVHDLDRLGLGEVEGEIALVGVDGHPGGGHVARRPLLVERAAAHVLPARPLDLDHVGAEQRQLVAAEGACEHLREVEDADAGEGFLAWSGMCAIDGEMVSGRW